VPKLVLVIERTLMATIKYVLGWLVATGYNLWALVPAFLQAALRHMFWVGLAFLLAFNWTIPSSLAGFQAEALLAWQGLMQVVEGVFDKEVLPNIIPYILTWLDLHFGLKPNDNKLTLYVGK
jgi:hypothetical protein